MKIEEVIKLLNTGMAVTFPVQYLMAIMLELSNSNISRKFTGILSNDEITIQFVEDATTLN